MAYSAVVPTAPSMQVMQNEKLIQLFATNNNIGTAVDLSAANATNFEIDSINGNGRAASYLKSSSAAVGVSGGGMNVTLTAAQTILLVPGTYRYTIEVQPASGDDFQMVAQGTLTVLRGLPTS
jgi:hypothetical protein